MPTLALPAPSTQVYIFFLLFYLFNFLYRSKCQRWHCRRHQRRYIYIFFLLFYLFNSLSRSEHQCRYVFFFSSFFICLIPCIEVNAKATTGAIDAGMYLFIFFLFIYLIPCIEVNAHAGTFFFFFFLFIY